MSLWYKEIEDVTHGKIYRNLFSWPYLYEIVYKDSSVIMGLRTLDEARIHAEVENSRRETLVIKKLKEATR